MSYSFPHSRAFIPVIEDTLGTADTLVTWKPAHAMTIVKVAFFTTTTVVNTSAAAVLTITYDSVARDTITLPIAGVAVGVETAGAGAATMPFDVAAGESVVLAVTTIGQGSQAGEGYWVIYYQEIPT